MSQSVRILTENPPVFRSPSCRFRTSTSTATFPGFVPGTSFDPLAPSRREVLKQFHRLEMMVEVEEQLRAENGLVLSDRGEDFDDGCPRWDGDMVMGQSRQKSAAAASLHDAHEELAGRSLHVDPYRMEDVWSVARREGRLEESPDTGEDDDVFIAHRNAFIKQDNTLEWNNHTTIMEDLRKVQCRMEHVRARQARHWGGHRRHSSVINVEDDDDESLISEEFCSSSGDFEFDPEHYVAPLFCYFDLVDGADLRLQQPNDESNTVVRRTTLHDILPDAASVQEAMRLLQFSIHSDRPDVAACVRRCQEEQRQHHPMTTITNLPGKDDVTKKKKTEVATGEITRGERTVEVVEEEESKKSALPCRKQLTQGPTPASLAAMVTRTLPTIPNELWNELADQRHILERLVAAQEASLRQLTREKQESTRRRLMSPRLDPSLPPLVSSLLNKSEPIETTGTLQSPQRDQKQTLPPVITITTMRPQSPAPIYPQAPSLPPNYMDVLKRLHCQYENLLRDERRAWTDIMKKQREAFEMEKNAAVETMRYAAVQRQHEGTEEIKRVIAKQEIKRQRLQHAAEMKQQQAFQQMLHAAMPSNMGAIAADKSTDRHGHVSRLPQFRKQSALKKKGNFQKSGGKNERKDSVVGKEEEREEEEKKSAKLRPPVVKGPYRVVLPDEEPRVESATPLDVSSPVVDRVVMLSDEEEEKDSLRLIYKKTEGNARVYTGWKRNETTLPTGSRTRAQRAERSPYAAAVTTTTISARRTPTTPHTRGLKPRRPLRGTRICGRSPYAFSLENGKTVAERKFHNTAESVLTESFHSCEENFSPSPLSVAANASRLLKDTTISSNMDSQAIFSRSILLFSDPLTSEEMAVRRSVERAYDVSLSIPPITVENSEGVQRPCDIYYFGKERDDMTPRRRAKLQAAEAQTCIAARRRLKHIKDLSLSSSFQVPGEPAKHIQPGLHWKDESEGRLASLLANETIHCIIGKEAEKSLFADLFQELERDLVRAELQRFTSRNMEQKNQDTLGQHQEQESSDGTDIMHMERVAATTRFSHLPVNEEYSLEETILRHIETTLLESIMQSTSESGKNVVEEKTQNGETSLVSHEVPVQALSNNIDETESKPLWVRDVVSATTDPLWCTQAKTEEVVVDHPRAASFQTPATTSGDYHPAPIPSTRSGVFVAVEGVGGNVVTNNTDTIRIIVDVAPVMQHLAANTLLAMQQPPIASPQLLQEKPAGGGFIESEERRLLCATEEDLLFCEVVDAPVTGRTDKKIEEEEEQVDVEVEVGLRVSLPREECEEIGLPLPDKGGDDLGIPQPLPPPPGGDMTMSGVPVFQQHQQYLELVHQREFCRCQEDEALQRQIIEEQEGTLRVLLPMMRDCQWTNLAMLHEHNKLVSDPEISTSRAVPHTCEVANKVGPSVDQVLSPVPPALGIHDPITRFIFEWMHEYTEKKEGEPARESFLKRLHEASRMAEGKMVPDVGDVASTVETNVCRSSQLDINNLEFSSLWLTSTNSSSMADNGFPRFASASRFYAAQRRRTYRRSDENASSKTTETTRYTNRSSSPLLFEQETFSGDNISSPRTLPLSTERNTTSTTLTTSGTSRTWPSNESSEKPRLRDTMLRRLCQIQSWGHPQYQPVEKLHKQVESVQATRQSDTSVDTRRQLFVNEEQLGHTSSTVKSLPLPHRPQWW